MTALGNVKTVGPLAGIRIIDLSRVLSGPVATMLLADQGADVIQENWSPRNCWRFGRNVTESSQAIPSISVRVFRGMR
jgi:hypothetical protein